VQNVGELPDRIVRAA